MDTGKCSADTPIEVHMGSNSSAEMQFGGLPPYSRAVRAAVRRTIGMRVYITEERFDGSGWAIAGSS